MAVASPRHNMHEPALCFVTDEIYPATKGGIGRVLGEIVQRLDAAGTPVVLVLSVSEGEAAAFRHHASEHCPGMRVHTVDELLTDLDPDEAIPLTGFRLPHYWKSYRIALALRRLCRTTKLAGIEFADFNGAAFVSLKWRRMWGDEFANMPMWLRLHGTSEIWLKEDDEINSSRGQQQLFAMERYALRHADGWLSPSASVAQWFREFYGCPDTVVVVDPLPFSQVGQGNQHPRTLGNPPHRILFFGKLQRIKGSDLLLKAVIRLLENDNLPLELEIVGPDTSHGSTRQSYRKQLERWIPPQWRDRIHFRGHIAPECLIEIARSCCLAVMPSRVETFCLAAHELNWIGIPLVLNDLPAFCDYFHDRMDCRTFDGSVDDLASVLRELVTQPNAFADWKWNAPEIIARQRTCEAYDEAIERFRPRTAENNVESAPLVSIVVPYYNMQRYVDATLASVEAGEYAHWEVILVDDGSPDPAAQAKFEALQAKHQNDPRYRFLQKPNGGLSSARNFAIQHARGKYVLPLDSDNLLDPRYLNRAVTALERLPDVVAVTCFLACFPDGKPPTRVADYIAPYDLHPLLILLENRAGDACAMFRREIFDRFRYCEEIGSYEDWDLWWQLSEAKLQVEAMPMVLLRYHTRPNSMVRTTGVAREQQILASFAERHPDYLRENADGAFRVMLRRIKELERLVGLLRRQSLLFRMAELVLRCYHAVKSRPDSLVCRFLGQLCRRSRRVRDLCARMDAMIP